MKLSDVLNCESAIQLDAVLASKGQSETLLNLGSPENTLRFMRACLRGSYLFGRHLVPNYMAHAFKFLTTQSPAINDVGVVLRGITNMCVGELSTNNIYGRDKECHAHFWDLFEAYEDAGGKIEEFALFMNLASAYGTSRAIFRKSDLWSKGSAAFAEKLLECCENDLQSFIVMPCNEILTTVIYPVAIKHICTEERFNKFRHFLEVHIQIDGDDHGAVALDWLSLYLKQQNPSADTIENATSAGTLLT